MYVVLQVLRREGIGGMNKGAERAEAPTGIDEVNTNRKRLESRLDH